MSELNDAIKSFKRENVVGPDGSESEHLLYAGPVAAESLLTIFNAFVATSHIPSSCRSGFIKPIPEGKDKDLSNLSNYRGISLFL